MTSLFVSQYEQQSPSINLGGVYFFCQKFGTDIDDGTRFGLNAWKWITI